MQVSHKAGPALGSYLDHSFEEICGRIWRGELKGDVLHKTWILLLLCIYG